MQRNLITLDNNYITSRLDQVRLVFIKIQSKKLFQDKTFSFFLYILVIKVNQENNLEIPLTSIGNVFRTKEELYTLFQNHIGYYLPPLNKTPVQFLKDVLVGKKILLKQKEVETTGKIPRFEEFRVKHIWELTKVRQDLMLYFPDILPSSNRLPDRAYLLNVLNTLEEDLITKSFSESMMKRREQSIKEREKDNNIRTIEIKPEILEKILGSQQESKRKGRILSMIQKKLAPKPRKARKKKFTCSFSSDFKLNFSSC